MAERKRRDEDPADEPLAEELVDDTADEDDDVPDDEDADDPAAGSTRSRGGIATKARRSTKEGAKPKKDTDRVGFFGRIIRFVREVVAELRKVIWPTRKELLTYTAVVVVFVTVMLAIVGVLDVAFARAVLWVFGGNTD